MKYRKKPIEVEAIVYEGVGPDHEGANVQAIAEFMDEQSVGETVQTDDDWGRSVWDRRVWPLRIWIEKSQAWGRIEVGDAVIRESDGSGCYPCAKAVFEATYESAEELNPLNTDHGHCACGCGAHVGCFIYGEEP